MTDAMIGYDTLYEIMDNTAEPPAYVAVAEVFNFTPGEATADRIDSTHYQSPGRSREYISGLIDRGEASVELNWVPNSATDVILRELFKSGEVTSHRVTFPNGVSLTYDASIIGYSKAVPLDDRMTATVTLAVSGDEVWEAA